MTEPIPLPQISAALHELVQVLHQDEPDPVARVLIPAEAWNEPTFFVDSRGIGMRYSQLPNAVEVAAAAAAFFGGEQRTGDSCRRDTETSELHTTFLGAPLVVYVPVPREAELAALRKENADLQAKLAAATAGVSQ